MNRKIILIILIFMSVFISGCGNQKVNQSQSTQRNSFVTNSNSIVNNSDDLEQSQNQQVFYKQYTNDRFGFSIEYPSIFVDKVIPDTDTEELQGNANVRLLKLPDGTMEQIPTKGSGKVFKSPDGSAELVVLGDNQVINITAEQEFNELLIHHSDAAYKKQEGNWYVVSWIDDMGRIVYLKSVRGTGSYNYFMIKYPSNQKDYYSPIISHINSSFKTPLIDTGR